MVTLELWTEAEVITEGQDGREHSTIAEVWKCECGGIFLEGDTEEKVLPDLDDEWSVMWRCPCCGEKIDWSRFKQGSTIIERRLK